MPKAIDLFYRTTTGKTESVAERIRDELGGDIVTLHEFGSVENDDFAKYECLIIACPTWNIGEVQSDQEGFFPNLMILILAAKKQLILELATKNATRINLQMQWGLGLKYREGGETVGYWSVDGQDFNESQAVVDGKLLGLAIDEDNQSDLTEARIKSWVSQLKKEFSL